MSPRIWIGIALAAAALATIVALRSCNGGDVASLSAATSSPGERAASSVSQLRRGAAGDVDATTLDQGEASAAGSEFHQTTPIVGVVRTDDGTPIAGAFVVLGDLDTFDDATVSGHNGRFELELTPDAFYSAVHAVALRDGGTWLGEAPWESNHDVDLVLHPPNPLVPVVLVRVCGHDGRVIPVAKAEAVGEPWRVSAGYDGESRVAEGWFTVSAARWRDGEAPVFIVCDARDADGRPLPYGPALVRVDLDGPSVIDVTLPEGLTLSGRVDLPDGNPAAGTKVLLVPPRPADFDGDSMQGPRDLTATTDAHGEFTFHGLAAGPGTLRVDEVEGVHAGSGLVDATAGGRDVRIQLRRAVPVSVAVRDAEGHAVAGINVELALRGEDWTVGRITNAEGKLAMGEFPDGAPGELFVDSREFVGARTPVVAGAPEIRVVLQRDAQIRGRVLGPDGEPVYHTSIRVDLPGETNVHWTWDDQMFTVFDVPLGAAFTLSLMDGERVLATTRAAGGDSNVELRWPADDDRLTIALPSFDHLSATTLTARAGSRVVANAAVNAGVVSIPSAALPEGAGIQIAADTRGNCVHLRSVPRHGFVRAQWTEIAKLDIRLTAPGGVPASFASCVATVDDTFTVTFEADEDGHAEVKLPPGRLVLTATARGGLEGSLVLEERAEHVDLALARR